MDSWVRGKAREAHARSSARVHVCVREDGTVCGVFAMAVQHVAGTEVSNAVSKGQDQLSALLLARFALDESARGGNGEALLAEVMKVCVEIDAMAPFGLLILDAKNAKLATYYEALGFVPFRNAALRLYMPMRKVRASVAAAEQAIAELLAADAEAVVVA